MIDRELIPVMADRFKLLGEAGRLAILAALQQGEKSVGELVEATGRGQPNVSQHLANLSRAGMVAARREGNRVFYRLVDPYVTRICDAVCDSLRAGARKEERWRKTLRQAGRRRRGRSRG